jgi:hypothetical protein
VTQQATGAFTVAMNPSPPYETAEGVQLGRVSIDKVFTGDLVGQSHVEMLSAMTPVKGSAGYVAIERVTGSLHGRSGTFVLQHSGTMTRGKPELVVSVVPDSGTGALEGIAGRLAIEITGGNHFYSFDYTIDAPRE